VGMGYSLAARFPEFEPILNETLREADASIGFSLSGLLKEGPAEKLKETEITQPALLAVSTAMGRWLKAKGKSAAYATGHSLGEYSALVHAESLRFQDAVQLVNLRGRLMQSAVPSGKGGMVALIGATPDAAQNLCEAVKKETGKILEPSVFNSPGQVVASGDIEAVDLALTKCKEYGIRMGTKLEVSGPFHCSLLTNAGKELRSALNKIEIRSPEIPVISNVTAREQTSPDEIRENLEKQVFQAVRWEECIRHAALKGTTRFVEVGSGKVLAGIIKKILPEATIISMDSVESLETI